MEISMALYDPNMFGPLKYNSIQNFALQIYARSGLQSPASAEPTEPLKESLQSSEIQKEVVFLSKPEDWDRECGKGYRGTHLLTHSSNHLLT